MFPPEGEHISYGFTGWPVVVQEACGVRRGSDREAHVIAVDKQGEKKRTLGVSTFADEAVNPQAIPGSTRWT